MARDSITLGIDARLYGLEHAGIGRYVMNLVDRVVSQSKGFNLTLFVHPRYEQHFPQFPHLKIISTTIRHYTLAEQTKFLSILTKEHLDLLHVPHFNVPLLYHRPFVVTIHDILWHQVKGGSVTTLSPLMYYAKYLGYQASVLHAVTGAKQILVPSLHVRNDVLKTYPYVKPEKILVTYEGNGTFGTKEIVDQETIQYGPYVLYIGSAYPHKNVSLLIKAVTHLRQTTLPQLKLIIVGSRDIFLKRLKQECVDLGNQNGIVFAGYQTDRAILTLLTHAVALVHPSKSEGFGLTGLEAMSAGCPVIAANATCLPEIYGDGALYFDPDNMHELCQQIQLVVDDANIRKTMIQKGFIQAKKYSWDTMANQTINVYKQYLRTTC